MAMACALCAVRECRCQQMMSSRDQSAGLAHDWKKQDT